MTRTMRILVAVGIGLSLAVILPAAAAAVAVYRAGFIVIKVEQTSPDVVSLPPIVLPAALVTTAFSLVPASRFGELPVEMDQWGPVILAAAQGLDRCEDGVLVEVDSAEERVRIAKSGGSIVIDVEAEDAIVSVSLPVRAVGSIVSGILRAPARGRGSAAVEAPAAPRKTSSAASPQLI